MDEPVELLRQTLGDLAALLESVTEPESWEPTGCAGWSVLDLAFHLLEDAHRALVDLATPADGPPDTDAVGYWRPGRPSPHDGDDAWSARVAASVQGGIVKVSRRHHEAAAAVVVAAGRLGMHDVVRSQGAVMTVTDHLSSMIVEAAIHHLDLYAWNGPDRRWQRSPRSRGSWRGCSGSRCPAAGTMPPPSGGAPDANR